MTMTDTERRLLAAEARMLKEQVARLEADVAAWQARAHRLQADANKWCSRTLRFMGDNDRLRAALRTVVERGRKVGREGEPGDVGYCVMLDGREWDEITAAAQGWSPAPRGDERP